MLKHVVPCLMVATTCLLFVVIPIDQYIHTDASGERFTVTPVPPMGPKYDVFNGEWWRHPETLRKARELCSYKTDEEFLQSLPHESQAYACVRTFLMQSRNVGDQQLVTEANVASWRAKRIRTN